MPSVPRSASAVDTVSFSGEAAASGGDSCRIRSSCSRAPSSTAKAASRERTNLEAARNKRSTTDDERSEEAGLGGREAAFDADGAVDFLLFLDVAVLVEPGDDIVAVVRNEEFGGAEGVGDQLDAAGFEDVETGAGVGADEKGVGRELARAGEHGGVGDVDFVENGDDGFVGGAELFEDAEGGGVVFFEVGIGDVDDVYQEVGDNGFLECGLERFDEPVGEAADEADGVGDEELVIAGEVKLAGGGIEGGEEFVFGEHAGAGEGIEEGGFAGVGVADDGGGGNGDAKAAAALDAALLDDLDELGFEAGDAIADDAAILFELGFALAAEGAFAALAGQVSPGAGEARKRVFHARERDLEDGFAGVGAVGEDLEDDLFAIDDAEAGEFFPIALLGGGELFVEDDDVGLGGFGLVGEFLGFSGAEKERGRGRAQVDERGGDDLEVEVFDELFQFREKFGALAGGHVLSLNADEEGAFEITGLFGQEDGCHQVSRIGNAGLGGASMSAGRSTALRWQEACTKGA